ncbi:site-specific integrase [Methylobacter sp. Wu1]|uniref:tyrosine-type recombinase/integrase n=1 Tax=Methylobacter sp. Wu1 TaxID=3119359 RepID=UPI002F9519C7
MRFLKESAHKKSIETDKVRLRWLHQYLHDKTLDQIDKALINRITEDKQQTSSNCTVNRNLALLRTILNRAWKDWEWIDSVPGFRMLPEQSTRVRWLTHAEAERLIRECPDHLKAMIKFTLATGLRESNVTGLQWSQIDMRRKCAWVHADEAKGKKSIPVPLNDEALLVVRQQMGKNSEFVFTFEGKPIKKAGSHAWKKALARAGIDNFRWHDLRHCWASWHIQNGTPLHVLKELGGWSDMSMVFRYSHLSADHLADYAGNTKLNSNNKLKIVRNE